MAERKRIPVPRLLLMAAVAGAFAGAVGVYVSGGLGGNNGAPDTAAVTPPGPSPDETASADAACAERAARAEAVGAAAQGEVAAMLPADPPQSLRTLSFNGPEGRPMSLADAGGKTVLLNLWATWCAPCREEMPALDALQKKRGGGDFEVIAVNIDTGDDSKPRKFLEEIGVSSLGFYRDASMGVFNELKKRSLALGLPVTLLIDPEGCLIAGMNGPADWASADAARMIDIAIGGKAGS